MISIITVASPLHKEEMTRQTSDKVLHYLQEQKIPCRSANPSAAINPGEPVAFLVATGGTEHLVMEIASSLSGPVVLIAHPHANSFPAALEILARLQQLGRKGKIVLLADSSATQEEVVRTFTSLLTRQRLRECRLGLLGNPSDWLVASMPDLQRMQEIWGPQIIKIPMAELIEMVYSADDSEAKRYVQDFQDHACQTVEPSGADLMLAAKVCVAVKAVVEKYRLDACTMRCFDLVTELRTTGCLALSHLLDQRIIAGCEGDLPSTLTMLWLHSLTGAVPFMANPQEIFLADNSVALAHCTIARSWGRRYSLRSHFESALGVGIESTIDPGPITLARLGGQDWRGLFVSDGQIVASENIPQRCRTQLRVQLKEDVRYFLQRPLGNHHVLIPGHFAQWLKDFHELWV